ncbi:MAG: DUF3467 domain-containing protein [Phycisphaerae bacterium]|jgi:hypothetical protein|nr:DUF3467 domain-containing protein [Phycisphaerae bacterium]
MAKDTPEQAPKAQKPAEQEAAAPQEQQQQTVRVRMDQRDVKTSYANAFNTHGLINEVILDFGLNMPVPPQPDQQPEIMLQITDRIILNYYSVKRLALTLGQLVRRHEERFGELELDDSKRIKND